MLFGLFLLIVGCLLLASQLLPWPIGRLILQFWPLALVILGLVRLIRKQGSRSFSYVLICAGLFFQLRKLGIIQGSLLVIFFALALVVLGLKLLMDERSDRVHFFQHRAGENANAQKEARSDQERVYDPTRSGGGFFEDKDFLHERFVFVNDERIYRSNTFSGGQVEALFSQVQLDLRNVLPLESEVRMDLQINFAEVTLLLPPDWHVIVNNKHFYSSNELHHETTPSTTLQIQAKTFLGNLKIQ